MSLQGERISSFPLEWDADLWMSKRNNLFMCFLCSRMPVSELCIVARSISGCNSQQSNADLIYIMLRTSKNNALQCLYTSMMIHVYMRVYLPTSRNSLTTPWLWRVCMRLHVPSIIFWMFLGTNHKELLKNNAPCKHTNTVDTWHA